MSRTAEGAGLRAASGADAQRALAWTSVALLFAGELRVPVQIGRAHV